MVSKRIANRFLVIRQIGEGGFGKVFLAFDEETGSHCAVKVLHSRFTSDRQMLDAFHREATCWMDLGKHARIVAAKSVDIFNGQLVISSEFIPPNESHWRTLADVLKHARLDLKTSLRIAFEICDGMKHVQDRGLVAHRDLKPANVLLDANTQVKITDFGLAVSALRDTPATYGIAGTPAYMSPEQLEGRHPIDMRSDVYSFGLLLYQLVRHGELPFVFMPSNDEDIFSYAYRLHASYSLPKVETPVFPILQRCLMKSAKQRYSDFGEIGDEIKSLYDNLFEGTLRRATSAETDVAEFINYSTSYMLLGDVNSALEHIDKALSVLPGYPLALNNKAGILASRGQIKEAVSIWSELVDSNCKLGRPYYNLANVAMQSGDKRAAVSLFHKALTEEPTYIPAIVNLAICLQSMGRIGQAIECYDRACQISPNDAQIKYNQGFLFYEIGQYDDAISILRQVTQLNPAHVSAYNYIGLAFLNKGDPKQAIAFFDAALSVDAEYRHAIENKKRAQSMLRR